MSRRRIDCRAADAIWVRRASGEIPSQAESEALADHLRSCQRCRMLTAALETVRYEDGAPPVEPMDEVTSRRIVARAVAQAMALESEPLQDTGDIWDSRAGEEPRAPAARGLKGRGLLLAVAGAAGLAVIVVSNLVGHRGGGPRAVVEDRATRQEHFVALLSPRAARQDGHLVAAGNTLAAGREVQVSRGQLAVALGRGAVVEFGPATRAILRRPGPGLAEVQLLAGSAQVLVPPGRGLRVALNAGGARAVVVGTFFRMWLEGDCPKVAVLHGIVAVQARDGTRQVASGQLLDLCRGHMLAMGPERARDMGVAEDKLHLLATSRGTKLIVESIPSGAAVTLDGVFLGRTPVEALVSPGHRKLRVSLGGAATQEYLSLEPGSLERRSFVLEQVAPPSSAGSGHVSRGRTARPRTPRGKAPNPRDRAWAILLRQAQDLRRRHEWQKAARAYRAILRRFPGTRAAQVARVSLGYLELEHLGRPTAALRHFRAYLARGGGLAEEAAWGEIRCLRALGRGAEERRALVRFLARHPDSLRASTARKWLQELGARSSP